MTQVLIKKIQMICEAWNVDSGKWKSAETSMLNIMDLLENEEIYKLFEGK